jgi:hypothetical protein
MNDIELIFDVNTDKTKIILINADYIINHKKDFYLLDNYINFKNIHNTYIWDYNPLNIKYYNTYFLNKKFCYIPLLYNSYLKDVYQLKISYKEKQNDVLFLGSFTQSRRQILLNNIATKYKLQVAFNINNIKEYIYMIENSKIILNIYSKEDNMPFDYYRFALLFANKAFVINELPIHINTKIEPNLIILKDIMINTHYDNIINEIDKYLNKTEEEINIITDKIYNNFKQFDMNKYVIDFFSKILNT